MADTVGKLAGLLLEKADNKHSVVEQTNENLKEYEKEFLICLERGKKLYDGDFFIEVQAKKEKLMENVIRHYFIPKKACPTPTWDQHVYHYIRIFDQIEYLWSVPNRETCDYLIDFALQIPKEEKKLLEFVMDFKSGELDAKARKLNGEDRPQATIFTLENEA